MSDRRGARKAEEHRSPPHNLEAEQALLGALLVNNDAFHLVATFLKPDHFFLPVHGRIYDAVIYAGHYGHTIQDLYLRLQLIFLAEDMRNAASDASLDQPPREQVESVEASLEMSAEQLGKRARSIRTGIEHHLLRTGKVEQPAFDSLFKTAGGLKDIPLVLDDTGGQTPDYIERSARRLRRQNRLDLLIVDLLQLMRSPGNCGPRTGSSRSATSPRA